jgi:hypothetical protein
VKPECDPLIQPFVAVNNGPDEIFRVRFDYLEISTEGFEAVTTPNIEVRGRVAEWSKVRVKNIFVKNG